MKPQTDLIFFLSVSKENLHFPGNYRVISVMRCAIWYHLYNFKKREKHPYRSVTFSKFAGWKPATLLKVILLDECFLRFLSCCKTSILDVCLSPSNTNFVHNLKMQGGLFKDLQLMWKYLRKIAVESYFSQVLQPNSFQL